ncbi:MAG: hypothetical protein V7756_07935 [Halopseudomonas sp.]|uniref:hypothetical protein n=1 Tax=Halopseudomonas sp. TaxID=2901191 RepID=UPI00300271B3
MSLLSPLHPAQLVLGLMVWSGWFVFLYGGLALVCEFAPPAHQQSAPGWPNVAILLLGCLLAAFLLWCARRCWRAAPSAGDTNGNGRFVARVAAAAYLIAALAGVALSLPGLALPPCL